LEQWRKLKLMKFENEKEEKAFGEGYDKWI
jgi:hypothetical protein